MQNQTTDGLFIQTPTLIFPVNDDLIKRELTHAFHRMERRNYLTRKRYTSPTESGNKCCKRMKTSPKELSKSPKKNLCEPSVQIPIVTRAEASENRKRRKLYIDAKKETKKAQDFSKCANMIFLHSTVGPDGELITLSMLGTWSNEVHAMIDSHFSSSNDWLFTYDSGASCNNNNSYASLHVSTQHLFNHVSDSGKFYYSRTDPNLYGDLSERTDALTSAVVEENNNINASNDYEGGSRSRTFRENIRVYNSLFQFTLLGAKVDTSLNSKPGPFVFTVNGLTFHSIGSLLPVEGQPPRFAQLYVYDTDKEVENRINSLFQDGEADNVDPEIICGLIDMLNQHNEIAKVFRTTKDHLSELSAVNMKIRLIPGKAHGEKVYAAPTGSEVAGLIVGDIGDADEDRDIIIKHKSQGLQRISTIHPLYMSLQYPLLFPYGQDEFRVGIKYTESSTKDSPKRNSITMREYYAYQIQQRDVEFTNVRDALDRGDVDGSNIGKRIILPASYTRGPRYMFQNYLDAMAICRVYGYPTLFLTFTTNPKWDEIHEALKLIPGQRPEDRPDLVSRVFRLKLRELMKDLVERVERSFFGCVIAASDIDQIISAELPDPSIDPIGYEAVSTLMMHGPCGVANREAPCMTNGSCNKYFPKSFQPTTIVDESGFAVYRRRDTGITCKKGGIELDNRFVVPHNVDLTVQHNAHINVEICSPTAAIKYLFKYLHKGPDRAKISLEQLQKDGVSRQQTQDTDDAARTIDEIKQYLDCRYVAAHEACWRIFEFDIHFKEPSVQRLLIHLPDQHTVYFHDNQSLRKLLARPDIEKTMFTEWFETNKKFPEARKLLYADFPTEWVWLKTDFVWKNREQGRAIGRITTVPPQSGELYYLRLLLNVVRGARSYEELRTVNAVLYPTFQRACEVLGLLGDDKEWQEALTQTSHWATSPQLRQFFVLILIFCDVANPAELFEKNLRLFGDDIVYRFRQAYGSRNYKISDPDLRSYVLVTLEDLLLKHGSCLAEKKLPQPKSCDRRILDDRLIHEELNYDCDKLKEEHLDMVTKLNDEQRVIYYDVMELVLHNSCIVWYSIPFDARRNNCSLAVQDTD
ncbi:hypothetical protein COLO4_37635 [Corchorus olitorius]|uniref:Helitron helicase-like domain-containing protein n=1 Tax=Corchorus olitorius TaxID=93759 RepID=A0A1R3G0C5_9ROSI|nr:hypothetical protein COLO4_37635 [Corchorus olitorius]